MKNNRRRSMEQFIQENETVTMQELVNKFGVSINTVRSDIKFLVDQGLVKKVYGGVSTLSNSKLTAFDTRSTLRIEYKKQISKFAASLIEDGDVVFIDSGTTTMYIVDYIDDDREFTLITHNLNVINSSILKPNITVISLPGIFDRKTRSYVDISTNTMLKNFNVNKSFIATTAITDNGNLSNSSSIERDVKNTALEICEKSYLLVDSSKFSKTSLMTFGSLKDISLLITDEEVSAESLQLCSKFNLEVKIVS